VQDASGEIAWPPDQAVRMNVAGFQQALDAAVPVKVASDLIVPVASLPAQAMLKLIAWQDRHAADRKDAIDLLFLMSKYAQAGNMDRLYGEDFALVERFGHDPDIAGAALLGREMATVASVEVRARLLTIVAPDDPEPPILTHMVGYRATLFGTDKAENIAALFDAFRHTFHDAAK
jgi:predicted nucleotidyltransferase